MQYDVKNLLRLKKSTLLENSPIYHDSFACLNIYDSGVSFSQLYTHDILEVSVVVSGGGIHRVLDQAIPCKAGDIYITSPDIPHGYFLTAADEKLEVRRLFFDIRDWFDGDILVQGHPRYCYGIFRDNPVTAYAMLNAQTQQLVNVFVDAIIQEAAAQQEEWEDAVRAYLSQFLITLSRYINGAIKNTPAVYSNDWGLVLATIRVVMEQFDDCDLTLESIADSLYISKSHLSRLFKRLTGESFSDYLRVIRLDNACRLLRETDLTVEEIVSQCGLRDLSSFYKNFNTRFDTTPHQYRMAVCQTNLLRTERKENEIMSILNDISTNLQQGRAKNVKELVQKALDAGCQPAEILNEGLLSGMAVIGEKFKNNEVYVPEVLVAARAMNMGAQILKPHLAETGVKAIGRACIGTVQGDLHDIGKNLVKMMLEGKGLEVIDLGVDVPPEKFVQTAIEQECRVICCSALLTTTMCVMADVVNAANEAGIRDRVKIMVGGAPVTEDFCREIGADCYTPDAASAADAAAAFCKA